MKTVKKLFLVLSFAAAVLLAFGLVVSCGDPEDGPTGGPSNTDTGNIPNETNTDNTKWTVFFDSRGGSHVQAQAVTKNQRAAEPVDPSRLGFVFDGWYTTEYCSDPLYEEMCEQDYQDGLDTFKWNFASQPVTDNMILYARWTGGQKWLLHDNSWRTWKYWFGVGQVVQLDAGTYDAGMVIFGYSENSAVQEGWFSVFRYDADGKKFPMLKSGNQFVYENDDVENGKILMRNSYRKYVTKPKAGESLEEMYLDAGAGNIDDEYGPVLFFPPGMASLYGYYRGDTTFTVDQAGWYFVCYEAGLGYHENGINSNMHIYEMYIKKHGYSDNLLKNGDLWFMDQDDLGENLIIKRASELENPDMVPLDFIVGPAVLTANGPNTAEIPGLAPGKWYMYDGSQEVSFVPYSSSYWSSDWGFIEGQFPQAGYQLDWPQKSYDHWF